MTTKNPPRTDRTTSAGPSPTAGGSRRAGGSAQGGRRDLEAALRRAHERQSKAELAYHDAVAARRAAAVALRESGYSYQAIGDVMGRSWAQARRLCLEGT